MGRMQLTTQNEPILFWKYCLKMSCKIEILDFFALCWRIRAFTSSTRCRKGHSAEQLWWTKHFSIWCLCLRSKKPKHPKYNKISIQFWHFCGCGVIFIHPISYCIWLLLNSTCWMNVFLKAQSVRYLSVHLTLGVGILCIDLGLNLVSLLNLARMSKV